MFHFHHGFITPLRTMKSLFGPSSETSVWHLSWLENTVHAKRQFAGTGEDHEANQAASPYGQRSQASGKNQGLCTVLTVP